MGHSDFIDKHIDEPIPLFPVEMPPNIEKAGGKLEERARRLLNNPEVLSACTLLGTSLNNIDFLRLLDFRRKAPNIRVTVDSPVFSIGIRDARSGTVVEMVFEKMQGANLEVWGALKGIISRFMDSGEARLEFRLTPIGSGKPLKYALKKTNGALELCRVKERTIYSVLSSAISLCKMKDMMETETIAAARDYLEKRKRKGLIGGQTAQFAAKTLEDAADAGENPKMAKLYLKLSLMTEKRVLVFCQSEEQEKLLNEQFGIWFPSMMACHKLSNTPAAKAAEFDTIIIFSRPGKSKAFEKYLSLLPKGLEIMEFVAKKSIDAPKVYPSYNAKKGGAQLKLPF